MRKAVPNNLFGFLIGNDIQIDILNRRVIRVTSNQGLFFCAIILKKVMMDLLVYLLLNAIDDEVSKDELLKNVWEEKNLRASSQRLWQVINELKVNLVNIGFPIDFIVNIRGHGYKINYEFVKPIYY